ncbi:MAG TPA: glyoxylate/hydroxypyruvate reductase A [Burkholderiaceae bacterium]
MTTTTGQPCIALLSEALDLGYLAAAFEALQPGIALRTGTTAEALGPPDEIDAAVCWFAPHGLLAQLPRLKLIQSLAAGVDHLLADRDLPHAVPLCRVVDATMAAGMKAYVTWAVVQQHRRMQGYLASAAAARWEEQPITSPRRYRVGIAGLGALGMACARALAAIGYDVRGWSRSPKADLPDGVAAFHGDAQLAAFLSGCDALVCLLPLTPQTHGFLNAECFAQLPRGAHLINVGRGDHLVEADLLAALASGQLGAATLDAFSQEPLPSDHPFWRHPNIVVTPHVATRSDPAVIARQTLDNLAMVRRGERPVHQVDRERGY